MESEGDINKIEGEVIFDADEETDLGNSIEEKKMCNAALDTDINFHTIENRKFKSNADVADIDREKHSAGVGTAISFYNIENGNGNVGMEKYSDYTENNQNTGFDDVEANSRKHTTISTGISTDICNTSIENNGGIEDKEKKDPGTDTDINTASIENTRDIEGKETKDIVAKTDIINASIEQTNDISVQGTNNNADVGQNNGFATSAAVLNHGDFNGSISPECSDNDPNKEIPSLKNKLEKQKSQVMYNLVSLDNQRLALQESSLLIQNKILQQRRVILQIIEEITNDRIHRATKNVNKGECSIDQTSKILEKRKEDLQECIGKLASLQDDTGSESVPDVLTIAKKIREEAMPKLTPLKLSYMEFVEGIVNFETLSSMIGLLQSTELNKDDQKIIASKILEGTIPGLLSRSRTRDVSMESSGTQISSGELSDHLTASTQTDFDGDKGCIGPAEGSITLTVNVDDIEENLDRCMESTPLDLLGLSWRIVVYKHWRDTLQIRLYYKNLEFIEKNVEYVEYGYTFKLLNHMSETWSICKKESHKIGRDAWWDSVIGWRRLEDPKNGYVDNKWFTIQAKVAVLDVRFY